jgi:Flp pilus assembly protein TadG
MTALGTRPAPRHQRGVYAIEFAFVFLIFFAVLYGAICYGMLFAFRLGLQNAAEDGARAALRYQDSLAMRKTVSIDVAQRSSSWMPRIVRPVVVPQICRSEGNDCAPASCGPAWNQRCQVVVTVTASNMQMLLPPLPSFAMPNQIVGKASMLLDSRSMP